MTSRFKTSPPPPLPRLGRLGFTAELGGAAHTRQGGQEAACCKLSAAVVPERRAVPSLLAWPGAERLPWEASSWRFGLRVGGLLQLRCHRIAAVSRGGPAR